MRVRPLATASQRLLVGAVATTLLLSGCFGGEAPKPTPASTPVAAPSGGSVTETVAPVVDPTPVTTDLKGSVAPMAGVDVSLAKLEAIDVKAQAPGDISGPAVAVTLKVTNSTGETFDPSKLQIEVSNAKGVPGTGVTGSPAAWLTDGIPAGKDASGVYVFTLPEGDRKPITVSVVLAPGLPRAEFVGNL
ncbi:MAG: hypothetical protein QM713_09095 [Arachnia sp.]